MQLEIEALGLVAKSRDRQMIAEIARIEPQEIKIARHNNQGMMLRNWVN